MEVHDKAGALAARVAPGSPCHATFGATDLVVGDSNVDADGAKWTWSRGDHGIAIQKDGTQFARWVVEEEETRAGHGSMLDANGVAMIRVSRMFERYTVATAGGVMLRGGEFHGDQPFVVGDFTVTGAHDGYDAAMIAAPEVPPVVRAIAMCRGS